MVSTLFTDVCLFFGDKMELKDRFVYTKIDEYYWHILDKLYDREYMIVYAYEGVTMCELNTEPKIYSTDPNKFH